MFRKLLFAGVVSAAIIGSALAVTTGTYTDVGGNTRDSLGVELVSPSVGITHTDASIASASGASQTVVAASANRKALIVANPAATTWWINPSGGTAVANCAGCFELPPGAYWSPRPPPTNAVTGIGTAASKLTVTGG